MAPSERSVTIPAEQRAYWDRAAAEKTFGHPLRLERLRPLIPEDARILDFGCGYGRLCSTLRDNGYGRVTGIDSSRAMVERGKREHPDLNLNVVEGDGLSFADGRFDAVLLFSVLTCIPGRTEQERTLAEIRRVLGEDGVLYISDLPLQDNERNRVRYADGEKRYGRKGVFELPEGVVLTHIDMEELPGLLSGFTPLELDFLELETMNGNTARAFQWIGRRL